MNTQPAPAIVHRQRWADDFNGPVATGRCVCGAPWDIEHAAAVTTSTPADVLAAEKAAHPLMVVSIDGPAVDYWFGADAAEAGWLTPATAAAVRQIHTDLRGVLAGEVVDPVGYLETLELRLAAALGVDRG